MKRVWARVRRRVRRLLGYRVDSRRLRAPLLPATWCLDRATISGSELVAGGWAFSADGRPLGLAINGRPFGDQAMGLERPDLVPLFSHVADATHTGFACRTELMADELDGTTPIEIQCVDPRTLIPFRDQQGFFVPPPSVERWPLPDAARMRRVHGGTEPDSFRLVGYSNFMKLDRVLRRLGAGGFEGCAAILDWGCGCGRLLRYVNPGPATTLTGVDIDADNVAWCEAHLPFASYGAIPLHPPTRLADRAFDAIIGVSIFTHLTESVQDEWLAELRRIARPGAVLLMTIHGPAVTAMGGNVDLWEMVEQLGFVDGSSSDLDEVLADKSYYRNSFHSHEYVRRRWSRYFDVVDIVPACIGNMQDLVVLRARG